MEVLRERRIISKSLQKNLAETLNMKPEQVKYAYLQHGNPSLEEVLLKCIEEKAQRIIIHPLFSFFQEFM